MKRKQKNVFMLLFLTVLMTLSPIIPYLQVSVKAEASTNGNSSILMTESREDQFFTWDNATVYFAMTDRFKDGNPSNNNSYGRPQVDATGKNIGTFHGGDLQGLTDKLNEGYFTDLGINAIWITAPYEQVHGWVGGGTDGDFAHYAFHGYYALDYTTVDQNMGTVNEMREFVDTAHANGIRVVLDIVMNHPGYNTIKDMHEYEFGSVSVPETWTPGSGQNWHSVHDYIDYDNANAWRSWWGQWVRAGIAGYTPGGNSELTMNLAGLPDFRTELTHSVGLSPILVNKWDKERNGYDNWIVPAARDLRRDLNIAPADYIVKWLSAWVEEFGIDGFRVDTAKHVDMFRWQQLKDAANDALWTWRENNPDAPGAQWTDDFWMTAEVWGHGVGRSSYFDNGFDSVINFTFQGEHGNGPAYNLQTMEDTFSRYASAINSDATFNVLSYISQHDTMLYPRGRLVDGGTYLMLLPGAVQVFYGDETARQFGETGSDPHQGTRSSMNWNSINYDVLNHWQKMGQFRNNHVAIGAGQHQQIAASPYTFSRTFDNGDIDDRVVVVVGASGNTTVNVGSVFSDGQTVRDFYTDETGVVQNGRVTFPAHRNGVILIEREGGAAPSVTASPNGGEFDTETIDVTLGVNRAEFGTYTIVDGNPRAQASGTFENGDVITIGEDMAAYDTAILTLQAENEVGEVIQEFSFTKIPAYAQVSADVEGGTFTGDSVEVTLRSKNVDTATYSINGGEEVAYNDGDKIIIGEGAEEGEEFVLALRGENEFGEAVAEYTFRKVGGLTVNFKKPANWDTPQVYFYDTDPEIDEPTWQTAPAMERVSGDWYTYTIDGAESAYIIFKDSNNRQMPVQGQPGFFRDAEGWFDGQEWHNENPDRPVRPDAPSNLASTEVTRNSVSFNWSAPSQNVDLYNVFRDGVQIAETTSTNFVDADLQPDTTYRYSVVAVNEVGESPSSNELTVTTRSEVSNSVTIYYKGFDTPFIHYRPNGGTWTNAPGVALTPSTEFVGYHEITIDLEDADGLTAAFNNGRGQWDNNGGSDYQFGVGIFTFDNGTIVEGEPKIPVYENEIVIYYQTNWTNPHIHYQLDGGQWTQATGVRMEASEITGFAKITIPANENSSLRAAFNNGSGQWDNNGGRDYTFTTGEYTVRNGQVIEGKPDASNKVTIYYFTGWQNARIHYAPYGGQWTQVPGVTMTRSLAYPGYSEITIDLGAATGLQAVFNNGAGQWDNNRGRNYHFSQGTYTVRDGQVLSGRP